MIRTYLAVTAMVIYIFLNTIILLPILLILNEQTGIKLTKIVKKYYGRFVMWLIGADVKIIHKNYQSFCNIKNKESIVVVANHQSFIDIPLILGYLDINVGFVAKKEIKKWYLFNLWMDRAQCVFLDRTSSREGLKSFKNAIKLIQNGKSVCIFPEGTRTFNGEVGEFKKGSFKLALEPKVKILPVTINGTYQAMNKNKFYINFGKKIQLIIDEPIDIKKMKDIELKEINNKVRYKIIENLKSY